MLIFSDLKSCNKHSKNIYAMVCLKIGINNSKLIEHQLPCKTSHAVEGSSRYNRLRYKHKTKVTLPTTAK